MLTVLLRKIVPLPVKRAVQGLAQRIVGRLPLSIEAEQWMRAVSEIQDQRLARLEQEVARLRQLLGHREDGSGHKE